jgi:predicted GH43/DUF377 family glycosyl hydrolase
MLVVIPVCAKDEALVLKNLDWVKELDGLIPAEAIISSPEEFDVKPVLNCIGRQCTVIRYPEWGGTPKWPHPQNWAWQSTARAMSEQKLPWLWWEADSTPLVKGWYDIIKSEYASGGKPFMGCITERINGWEPHMNGVGVYPADVASYSVNAMLCRSAPFDIVAWRDTAQYTHRANHIIQHHCREDGDSTHFPDQASVESIVHPGVVLFHRTKDGSLIDRLRDPKSVSEIVKSWFPKPAKAIARDWPSIKEQTKWQVGFFDLPSHERECHFNCSIVEDDANVTWLVSRRWRRTLPETWRSDIVRHRLDSNLAITKSIPIGLPKQGGPMEQHEDPRIIRWGTGFAIGYCHWIFGRPFQAQQALAAIDTNWNCVSVFFLIYGKNGPGPGQGRGNEKNWTWFYQDRQLFMDYQFSPHIVVEVKAETKFKEYVTDTPLASRWKHGHIRGGTPPVRVGDEYISFFHSSIRWTPKQNRYLMGAYAFQAQPPFAVTRITSEPLLAGSDKDIRTLGGPLVVFPDGALFKNDEWLVTFGVNDQACAWIKIPHQDLLNRMT